MTIKKIKSYPHFDAPLSSDEVERLLESPARVAANAFFPFLSYAKRYQPFRLPKSGAKPEKKSRPIAYASRRDAAVFEHYRGLLSEKYEEFLASRAIAEVPIAYRKLPAPMGGGKCNIDFAKDAFDAVTRLERCRCYVIDISKYFPSISHDNIYRVWCELLCCDRLPVDHYAVFKAITQYSYVDREELYKELGFIGPKIVDGQKRIGYLRRWDEIPTQICSPTELREVIQRRKCAGNSILFKNTKGSGIPQGAPISDVLANMNLMHFDCEIDEYVRNKGGYYRRYSDDIIIVLPIEQKAARVLPKIRAALRRAGDGLEIKNEKISVADFDLTSDTPYQWKRGSGRNGLEYLGFRFDGKSIYLRDKTLSNFFRKIAIGARAFVNSRAARFRDKDAHDIVAHIKLDLFLKQYGRVEDFEYAEDYRQWTFWTYVRRARSIFGERSRPMEAQLKRYKVFAAERLRVSMERLRLPT